MNRTKSMHFFLSRELYLFTTLKNFLKYFYYYDALEHKTCTFEVHVDLHQ